MSMNENSQAWRAKVVHFDRLNTPPRAYALSRGFVICPICSKEARLPPFARKVTKDGDGVFKCFGCEQFFLYNPFVDKPKEELVIDKLQQRAFEENLEDAIGEAAVKDITASFFA